MDHDAGGTFLKLKDSEGRLLEANQADNKNLITKLEELITKKTSQLEKELAHLETEKEQLRKLVLEYSRLQLRPVLTRLASAGISIHTEYYPTNEALQGVIS